MIAVIGCVVLGGVIGVFLAYWLHHQHGEALKQAYLEGFRDGQMAEAKVQQASAPKIVRVPLMGRN